VVPVTARRLREWPRLTAAVVVLAVVLVLVGVLVASAGGSSGSSGASAGSGGSAASAKLAAIQHSHAAQLAGLRSANTQLSAQRRQITALQARLANRTQQLSVLARRAARSRIDARCWHARALHPAGFRVSRCIATHVQQSPHRR
jgi:hypothetical protein